MTTDIRLTDREQQVLNGMAQGHSNGQIGRALYLSEDTVKTHARRLFRKLGANDRAHAVFLACRAGLLGEVEPARTTKRDLALPPPPVETQPGLASIQLFDTAQHAEFLARAIWPQHPDRALAHQRAREIVRRLTGTATA